jgi:NAD(P)-dependent dehydrogenase (short-subunit alcohol dehydrogenase family)
MSVSLPLTDKIALVTGATRGIGYAAALALAEAGAPLVPLMAAST